MITNYARGARKQMGRVRLLAAMGVLLAVSGCVASYESACVAAGRAQGSAEFDTCIQQKTQMAHEVRMRHLKYGSGG
jgi:hypothetical protein